MRLNTTTDYAIRLILCLGRKGGIVAGPAIAEQMKIPPKYILKISSKLREAKLIGSIPGSQGGYYLMKPLEEITLLEVLNIMEPSSMSARCSQDDGYTGSGEAQNSSLHLYYKEIRHELKEKWLSRNLREIQERFWESERVEI